VKIERVAIIGAGHIGASIALSIRARAPEFIVTLYDASAAVRDRVGEIPLGIAAETAEGAVRGADLALLCVPVGAMAAASEAVMPHLKAGAILSDVGSVKAAVIAAVKPRADIFFVPASGCAGTKKMSARGLTAAITAAFTEPTSERIAPALR